jgi:hypothetical protein
MKRNKNSNKKLDLQILEVRLKEERVKEERVMNVLK